MFLRLLFDKCSDRTSWDKWRLSPYLYLLFILTQLKRFLFNSVFNRFCCENAFMLSKHEDLNHRLPILTPPLLEHHDQSQVYQFLSQCAVCFFFFFPLLLSLLLTGMRCPSLWLREYFPLGLGPSDTVSVRLFSALFSQSYKFLCFCSLNLPFLNLSLPCYHTDYMAL